MIWHLLRRWNYEEDELDKTPHWGLLVSATLILFSQHSTGSLKI